MATSLARTKKPKQTTAPSPPIAHFLPQASLAAAKRGDKNVKAHCGATVTGEPKPGAALCVECAIVQFEIDDKALDEKLRQRFDAGKTQGVREGQQAEVAARQRLEQERADQARQEAERPRFETVGNRLKLSYEDGSVATVRKNRVGAVRFGPTSDGRHAVYIDGVILIAHADKSLIESHYTQLHNAVFGDDE